ncbi:nucleotidyltransferase domain-containing protein [Halosimplex salinum]|uniref:nucleotidyltransferase domain-containing protein n=1 Tax=Halosimplex salinum TaxID=1710538 RepID=UPI000F47D71C|nr:nucleotidyltransferase domain-containing protein [Halosimplex salinum]
MAESTLPHREAVDAFVERVEDGDFDAIQRLYLFGSVARGTQRPDSDVDIFAVLDDGADVSAVEERLRDLAYDVMLEGGPAFSIHAVTESTVEARADHPFFRTALDEGRPIYG